MNCWEAKSHIHSVTPSTISFYIFMSAVAHNINNKPASNQRKQKLGGLFRNVFIHVWLRLGFFVSNGMSVEFSRNTIIPGRKFDVAGEKVRLIEKENQFILEKNFPRHTQTTLAIMGGRSE